MPSGSFHINEVFNGSDSEEEVQPKNNFQNFAKRPRETETDSDSDGSEFSNAEEMEEEHGLKTTSVDTHKKMKELLPFKSETGVIPRSEEVKKKQFEEIYEESEDEYRKSDTEEEDRVGDDEMDSDDDVIAAVSFNIHKRIIRITKILLIACREET